MINVSNARKLATWHAIAPHIRCFDCNNYGHVTKSHPQAHQQDAGTTTLVGMIDQLLKVIIMQALPLQP